MCQIVKRLWHYVAGIYKEKFGCSRTFLRTCIYILFVFALKDWKEMQKKFVFQTSFDIRIANLYINIYSLFHISFQAMVFT